MLRVVAVAVLLSAVPACRIFRGEEWARRDKCAQTLPVLRKAPDRDYRRIQVVKDTTEDGLAWQACGLGADAVLVEGGDEIRATRNVKGIAIRFVRSQSEAPAP